MTEDEIELKLTDDGSHTLYSPRFRQYYHSYFGAWQESLFIYIQEAWEKLDKEIPEINIFELGMGTGLDVMLTLQKSIHEKRKVYYFTTEPYPPPDDIILKLNHPEVLKDPVFYSAYNLIHACAWEEKIALSDKFVLHKTKILMENIILENDFYHLVYFDAFGPNMQPDLWTTEIFQKLFAAMKPNGILTTYCAKGQVRRNMQAAGFTVERLPGPLGKREILRARKLIP